MHFYAIKNVIINENHKRTIRETTANPTQSFGTFNTHINMEDKAFNIKFNVVPSDLNVGTGNLVKSVDLV